MGLIVFCGTVYADKDTDEKIQKIAEALQGNFPNARFEKVEPTHIPGIYAFYIMNKEDYRIMYWHHPTQTIIFGEMVTKNGVSLTAEKLAKFKSAKMKDLDKSLALKIGDGENEIIEFIEPECIYCYKYQNYIKKYDNVTRYIFFHNAMGESHPGSDRKSIYVLCSDDPEKALDEVFKPGSDPTKFAQCEKGTQMLKKHTEIATRFKVSGTPTLIVNGTVVAGFGKTQLDKLLKKGEKS